MHSSSLVKTPNLQLVAEQPWTGECWNPPVKDTPHPTAKRKPKQDSRRSATPFKMKPHTAPSPPEMLGEHKKILCTSGPRERNSYHHKKLKQTIRWLFEGLLQRHAAVAYHEDRGSDSSRPGRHDVSHESLWRRSLIGLLQSHQVGNAQTGEQLCQRSSCTVAKVLDPTKDFPTWGSGRGTENPQGIWLWRSARFDDKLRHFSKNRHITLLTKVHIVRALVFLVIMYGYESWIIYKAECQNIDAFELWCWRRLLRAPWITRKSKQSILKEINAEYSLERLMLKLKLQYFGHLTWRTNSLEKTLMLG